MGPLDEILKMMPGSNSKLLKNVKVDEDDMKHIEAIICSMTNDEKLRPHTINGSRRRELHTEVALHCSK